MSRWAETFVALSRGLDTVDTMRHYAESSPTVSQSVHTVTQAGRISEANPATTPLSTCGYALQGADTLGTVDTTRRSEAPPATVSHTVNSVTGAEDNNGADDETEWSAIVACLDPDLPPGDVPPRRWRRFVDDVGHFLDGGFAPKANALGWGLFDLFGCDRERPFARTDQAGLLWLLNGNRLVAVSENTAVIETRTGARQVFRRKPNAAGRVLAWELRP